MSAQLEDIASLLGQSPDFRVLRRLQPHDVFSQSQCEQPLVGVVLDSETTGLDLDKAEVIELAMLKFLYTPDGEVLRVIGKFDELRQPAHPIPAEITALTGITDEMVAGHSINPAAVEAFVADVAIVIAHNARFDRPIAEKAWPVFKNLDWACSLDEIPWREHGFEGSKLAYLLMGAGLFTDAHRASGDPRLRCRFALRSQGSVESARLPLVQRDERSSSLLVARRRRARPRGRTRVPARQRLPAPGRSADAAHHRP